MHSFQQTNYINTTFITLLCKKIAKQWQMQVRTGNDRKTSEWLTLERLHRTVSSWILAFVKLSCILTDIFASHAPCVPPASF